ncbi:MAG: carboxypeptidase-like regulatory domain-containing protein [Flavobacteriaceae bacterium]
MIRLVIFAFVITASSFMVQVEAQSYSSRIIDAKTGEPIPYATVQFGKNRGIITNDEGSFSLFIPTSASVDSLFISCMGYEKTAVSMSAGLDSLIAIDPKPIELSEVYLFDNELDVDEIISRVKTKLAENYHQEPIRQRLFFRKTSLDRLRKFDIEFKESTIEEFNEPFIDSVLSVMPKGNAYYTESLCDLFKSKDSSRLKIEKAAKLYDKDNEVSMEAIGKRMEDIFKANVKPDSYLKIKSGIFGTKVQVDSILESSEEASEIEKEMQEAQNEDFHSHKRRQLNNLYSGLFYQDDSKLNFIKKSNKYRFSLKGYTSIDEQGVYVIEFVPKGGADFEGTLYVNLEDFAVMRVDYSNVKSIRRIKLLGFHYEETAYKGTTIYAKNENGVYDVRFINLIEGRYMGVDRPLKVIEKNKHVKGRRKQNELSLNINMINLNTEKYELVVYDSELISTDDFAAVQENDKVKATYLSRYDPEFWNGYNIMEPNQAIREFTVEAK